MDPRIGHVTNSLLTCPPFPADLAASSWSINHSLLICPIACLPPSPSPSPPWSQRTRRAAERRRAAAYDTQGGYAETPSQLFSTVGASAQERQPFTPAVNDRSTQIVREKQERALQMAQGAESHRSMGSNQTTPRVYGAEVAPRASLADRRHKKSKQEWNSMVDTFKQDFE